jgi:hypothetical protein
MLDLEQGAESRLFANYQQKERHLAYNKTTRAWKVGIEEVTIRMSSPSDVTQSSPRKEFNFHLACRIKRGSKILELGMRRFLFKGTSMD